MAYQERLEIGESWKNLLLQIGEFIRYERISKITGRSLRFKRRQFSVNIFYQKNNKRFSIAVYRFYPRGIQSPVASLVHREYLPEKPSQEKIYQVLQDFVLLTPL